MQQLRGADKKGARCWNYHGFDVRDGDAEDQSRPARQDSRKAKTKSEPELGPLLRHPQPWRDHFGSVCGGSVRRQRKDKERTKADRRISLCTLLSYEGIPFTLASKTERGRRGRSEDNRFVFFLTTPNNGSKWAAQSDDWRKEVGVVKVQKSVTQTSKNGRPGTWWDGGSRHHRAHLGVAFGIGQHNKQNEVVSEKVKRQSFRLTECAKPRLWPLYWTNGSAVHPGAVTLCSTLSFLRQERNAQCNAGALPCNSRCERASGSLTECPMSVSLISQQFSYKAFNWIRGPSKSSTAWFLDWFLCNFWPERFLMFCFASIQ